MTLVEVDSVVVGERHRQDLGDMSRLAASIEDVGLLHPIVLSDSYELVAGQRRLEAVRLLGHLQVEARVLPLSAEEMLRAEFDENEIRKDFTPTERVAIGRHLEDKVKRKAAERKAQAAGQPQGAKVCPDKLPDETTGQARDIVAGKVAWSGTSYDHAKQVVEAAEADPGRFGDLPELMDDTGRVDPVFKEMKRRQSTDGPSEIPKIRKLSVEKRVEQIRDLAEQGYRSEQIADQLDVGRQHVRTIARQHDIVLPDAALGKTRKIDPNRIISETVTGLEGTRMALDLIDWETLDLDPEQIEYWATSLNDSLKPLYRLRKQLKEMAHVAA